jgi:hypothetical protein
LAPPGGCVVLMGVHFVSPMMALTEIPQGCSSKFLTLGRVGC